MDKLIEKLKNFEKKAISVSTEPELQSLFDELAPAFLYGGYIKVRDDFKVYIRTVEFYFHSEKSNGIHDPIVYHRNGRDLEETPYFPLMSIHAHSSGFDIAFESETGKYRASALIRSYEVIDTRKGEKFLKWDPKDIMFKESDSYCFNSQSTYLKAVLNGFAFENRNDITWENDPRAQIKPIKRKNRKNVFLSASEKKYITTEKRCERNWSFTREDQIL